MPKRRREEGRQKKAAKGSSKQTTAKRVVTVEESDDEAASSGANEPNSEAATTDNDAWLNRCELARYQHIKRLRGLLRKHCYAAGLAKVPLLTFERWLARAQLSQPARQPGADHLLPSAGWADSGLVHDLTRAGCPKPAAVEAAAALIAASGAAATAVAALGCGGSDGAEPATVHCCRRREAMHYSLGVGGKPFFKLNHAHHRKLERLWRTHTGDLDPPGTGHSRRRFDAAVWRLLARYDAIGGAGFQSAVGQHGFDVLAAELEVGWECFASPLNCRFDRYCSAFPDTDRAFGAAGSFLRYEPAEGNFEANPPFVPELMMEMTSHIERLLARAQAAGGALSFVVLVPKWTAVQAWVALSQSRWCRKSVTIGAEAHGFYDGAQHASTAEYRPSSFDSSVFFLQTEAGQAAWPATVELVTAFKTAMAKAVPAEGGGQTIQQWEQKIKPLSSGGGKAMTLSHPHMST